MLHSPKENFKGAQKKFESKLIYLSIHGISPKAICKERSSEMFPYD